MYDTVMIYESYYSSIDIHASIIGSKSLNNNMTVASLFFNETSKDFDCLGFGMNMINPSVSSAVINIRNRLV